jgi:hypothetical protein
MTINHFLLDTKFIRRRLYTTIHHHTPPNAHAARRRLHGVQEVFECVLAVPSPSIPLMHQQLSMTITFSGPETLGNVTAS